MPILCQKSQYSYYKNTISVIFCETLVRDYTTIVSSQFSQTFITTFTCPMPELSVVEDSIKHCIKKNGFPKINVRLPFKEIYESCKKHDSPLKKVLANLAQDKIIGTIEGDFIEFRSKDKPLEKPKTSGKANDLSQTDLPNFENFQEMAQSLMSKMSPDQIKELGKTVANMSEEE